MPMTRNEFLDAIIDDGIMEITTTYLRPYQENKKTGGIKGFEICRGKTDQELLAELELGNQVVAKASGENNTYMYWHWLMYMRQIEWTINVLSAGMMAQGLAPIGTVTVRGYNKARNILNDQVFETNPS